MLALLLGVLLAAPAFGAERARLTWDTDETDVDLHIWDSAGNHAWYGDQTGIPGAELSTDVIFGFGPEHFDAAATRTYTYGVCYYGSNTADDSVPETVATVELVDPDGRRRTLKRTLRAEKEAYLLDASPAGRAYRPSSNWCSTGPYHAADDPGPAETTDGSFEGCPRVRRRIGPVELCADSFTGDGPIYSAAGNVRVNGSVYLGEGPVTVDVANDEIFAPGGQIAVLRAGQLIPIARGDVTIAAQAAGDPVSGRDSLARISIAAPQQALPALRVAGLPLSVAELTDGRLELLLDRREGGGVIVQTRLQLPFAGNRSEAALAVGLHARSPAAVRALGGQAAFGGVALPGGWALSRLALAYQEAGDVWIVSGGLGTPWFGLDLAGSLAGGQLNSLGVGVTRDVPLGTTGFVLTKLSGELVGLATPPLKISAAAWARWGSVPGLSAAVLHLDGVRLTVDLSGRASLTGDVNFLRSPSPVTGRIDLGFAMSPFRASGSVRTNATVGPLDVRTSGATVLTSRAFTSAGSADGRLRGARLAHGRSVLSDDGLGVTGRICVWRSCADVGLGMHWRRFPRVDYIGADIERFVTASGARVGATRTRSARTIVVRRGRPFLFVDASGAPGRAPGFEVRSPAGVVYRTSGARAGSLVARDAARGFTALTIARPRAGRWVVRPLGRARSATSFALQAIRRISRLRVVSVRPQGSRRRPLSRRRGAVVVRWTSRGLPRDARVRLYLSAVPGQLGRPVGAPRGARGVARIPRRLLARGASRIRLVVSHRGVALDNVLARQVIRAR